MAQQRFDDRFTYSNPSLAAVNVDTLSDAQLESLSPELKEMTAMVRRHSVLLRKKTASEIYNTITEHADPQIALVLAAAKDKKGVRIFPNLTVVKQLMFGPPDNSSEIFLSEDFNIFVQGIRRVSAALAASTLIGQLAQLPEQAQHSIVLEKQALSDLDRIISVPDLEALTKTNTATNSDDDQAFFIEVKELNLNSTIRVEVYLSSALSSGWTLVNNYTGELNTSSIAVDLADAINSETLVAKESNILAAPILAYKSGLHALRFSARTRSADVATEVIIARITHLKDGVQEPLPFKWGVEATYLNYESVNSALIAVSQGKVTTATSANAKANASAQEPIVLYFKRTTVTETGEVYDYKASLVPQAVWSTGRLSFRISPTVTTETTVAVPRLFDPSAAEQLALDNQRPAQVALLLLNELFKSKAQTRALGALIRNDDPTSINPLVGLELVAFSVTNPETWLVLDLLEVPADILVAVGDLKGPITPFSNKPRSVRVESKYAFRFNLSPSVAAGNLANAGPRLVTPGGSQLLSKFKQASFNRPYDTAGPEYYPYPPRPPYS